MSCSRTQHSDAGEAPPCGPPSRVKHSNIEPLCSHGEFKREQLKTLPAGELTTDPFVASISATR